MREADGGGEEVSDNPTGPYPLERYAKALEDLGNKPVPPYNGSEDPFEYAQSVLWYRGWCAAAKSFTQMLRGTPTSLWTMWPDYFPDPDEEGDDE